MHNLLRRFIFIFLVFMVIFAAMPIFAASARNPFMDVPENSWAYDAIARLASRGIISGYPDGLYKGRQSITRYEAASIVARTMAYFDSRRASVQDTETLKKLILEFKDELNVIGVQFDDIEKDAALFKERLSGWRMSGRIRMDADFRNAENIGFISGNESMGNVGFGDARLNIERWYGDRNSYYFLTQLRANNNKGDDNQAPSLDMYYFYTKIPFYYGSFLTVGRAGADNLDARFAYATPGPGRYSTWGWFDDSAHSMIKVDFNFVIFNFAAYIARGRVNGAGGTVFNSGIWEPYTSDAWNIFTNFDIKLSRSFGFGLGAQYLIQDDWNIASPINLWEGRAWRSIFTSWLGLDYNISDGVTAHGIIYYQNARTDDDYWGSGDVTNRPDGGIAWRAALKIDQDILRFTSLYAEYMRVPSGFYALDGIGNNMLLGDAEYDRVSFFNNVANHSISMWRIGANQRWNNKLSTWLYYADINGSASAGYSDFSVGLRQYGIGIEYAYNNYTMFGLNYLKWDGKDDWSDKSYSRVRFTTQVVF